MALSRSSARWSCGSRLSSSWAVSTVGRRGRARRPRRRRGRPPRLFGHLHDDVGGDALAVDRAALRREVLRGGQPQAGAVGERDDGLHRALAEALGADHDRAPPVLERAGHDLGGGRAALVDQHHDGEVGVHALGVAPGSACSGCARGPRCRRRACPSSRNFSVTSTAEVRRPPGLLRRSRTSPWIFAVLRVLVEGGLHVAGGLLLELAQADVLDAGLELLGLHRLHADLLAGDLEVLRLRPALAHDADRDLGAGLAAHALDRVGELHVLGGDALRSSRCGRRAGCPRGRPACPRWGPPRSGRRRAA